MGKLVLGIIAVTLLQIAFFVYMATDPPAYTDAGPVRSGPVEKRLQLSRAAEPPEVAAPSSPAPPEVAVAEQAKVKTSALKNRSLASVRTRPTVRDRDRAHRPPARVLASAPATPARSSRDWDAAPRRQGRLIPSGYTMALVDYPPAAARMRTPVVTSSQMSTVASIKTKEISQPRKRSFIARAAPALVKKPWNWIKSLASKLD
jgi:hypothetical protein